MFMPSKKPQWLRDLLQAGSRKGRDRTSSQKDAPPNDDDARAFAQLAESTESAESAGQAEPIPTGDATSPTPHSATTATTTMTSTPSNPGDLDDVEFYRGMRVMLKPLTAVINEPWSGLTNELDNPDEVFTRDSPLKPFTNDAVVWLSLAADGEFTPLTPDDLADRGPVKDLFRMGYRNLWQDLVDMGDDLQITNYSPPQNAAPQVRTVGSMPDGTPIDPSSARCWFFESDSDLVGSIPIFLEDVMDEYLPHVDRNNGLIFAMPMPNIFIVREVTSGADLMNTVGLMVTLAVEGFNQAIDGISPRLHLWHNGQIDTFTDIKWGEGTRQLEIQVAPTPYLMERIGEGIEPPDDGDGNDDGDGHLA